MTGIHVTMFRSMEHKVNGAVPAFARAFVSSSYYNRNMSKAPRFDWYLDEWMASLGINQSGLVKLAGWSKRKASDLLSGNQRYNRDAVNEAARALNIMPFELLMHPADAMAIRKMREGGIQLAAEAHTEFVGFDQAAQSRQNSR